MAVNSGAGLWGPFKELQQTVESAVYRGHPDAVQDLDLLLRKHKPDFISLLQNPAKNKVHRDAVCKADTEGIAVQGQQGSHKLSRTFIEEALIISDLFGLNEYAAVELLLAGESQQPYFPGLTRGLVAILLYYDGRASLISALHTLFMARSGRTFRLNLGEELTSTIDKFTMQIMNEGLTNKILGLLREHDIAQEMEKLRRDRALGNPRHRKLVMDKMQDIRRMLAECLYLWSCQTPLCRQDLLAVLHHLRGIDPGNADGSLNSEGQALLMAALYSIDIRIVEQEESMEVLDKLPVVSDGQYLPDIHREIISATKWSCPGLKTVVQFAWSLTLAILSKYQVVQDVGDICEQDETVLQEAIDEGVFHFLHTSVINSGAFHNEEFYIRQIHNIIADFIVLMPLKVKELRNRGDETARIIMAHEQEGVEPPSNLRHDFENLLCLISDLYGKDKQNLELSLEYWCPPEPLIPASLGQTTLTYKPPDRQISLYKFVRHAGDLLPPTLYIPYIRMLTGLANGTKCAYHCFNLLKMNGRHAGGEVGTVSWDHFFTSLNQYYTSLRQEASGTTTPSYRPHPRAITPQELDGLVSVLQLIRKIADEEENARVALSENPHWLPLVVMLGLIGCSVPSVLKAELLLTLAAFAKSPEIAASLWQSLEVAQIIPTISSGSLTQPGGIQVEVDEVEARAEEYPMTRAFLALLNSLTDIPVPRALGAGYRAPGFDPYLDFLRDFILLKFNSRAYKRPEERWEVCSAVLGVMHKLLRDHQVAAEDFMDQYAEVQGGGTVRANKPPGHSLMVHLMNDSSTLKMVLYVIDEATKLLDKYIAFPGKADLEKSAYLCLQMLSSTLEKQEAFLAAHRDSGATVLVFPLEELLLGINPRSGRPDHILNITKYVTYNSWLAGPAMEAVRILTWVCLAPRAKQELVGLLTSDQALAAELLHGFVECLETEDLETDLDTDNLDKEEESEESDSDLHSATRQNMLRLLLYTVDHPAPSMAHWLLGYNLRQPVAKTDLQDPGIGGAPRNCLHSLLGLLDRGTATSSPGRPSCWEETPKLAELAYQLIYVLCANKDTSAPTLRYLRTAHDFLYRQLQYMLLAPSDTDGSTTTGLSREAWLLKAVAIELRVTSANRQRSNTQRLVNLLLEDSATYQRKGFNAEMGYEDYSQDDIDMTAYATMDSQLHHTTQHTLAGTGETITGIAVKRKLAMLLDFQPEEHPQLQLDYFDPALVERMIHGCESRNESNIVLINVGVMQRLLMSELRGLQGSRAATHRAPILQEIRNICVYLVAQNSSRVSVSARRSAFEAWRQVIEVMLTACPEDLLQGEMRQNVIFELLQVILGKVCEEGPLAELSVGAAGLVLMLTAHLRQCFLEDPSQLEAYPQISQYVSMLDGSSQLPPPTGAMYEQASGARTLFSSSLQLVLKGLIEYILAASTGAQRVRGYLYGAMLYYLQVAQKPKPLHLLQSVLTGEKGVGLTLTVKDSEYDRLTQDNLATVSSYGTNFMDIVSKDACDGHDVGRMLALAVLDAVVTFDIGSAWLSFLTSHGYLQHLVDGLGMEDEELTASLQPKPTPLRALYGYQSKMGLLTRVALTASGAHTLLQCQTMARLADCQVFSLRPSVGRGETGVSGLLPPVMERYRQILYPALGLCQALLSSLGTDNRTATNRVLQFVLSHSDVFLSILRDGHSMPDRGALQELSLATAVISRAAVDDGETDILVEDSMWVERQGSLSSLRRQMISLLPRYCLLEQQFRQVQGDQDSGDAQVDSQHSQPRILVAEIAANVITFCRALVMRSGPVNRLSTMLFAPSLTEALSRDSHTLHDLQSSVTQGNRQPNLGLLVVLLRHSAAHFLRVIDTYKQILLKLDSVKTLGSEELKQLCGGAGVEKMSSGQRHLLAKQKLLQRAGHTAQELQRLAYLVENCLFLLWRHLEFYLKHCVATDQSGSLFQLNVRKQGHVRRLQDPGASWDMESGMREEDASLPPSIGRQELEELQVEARAAVNDSLFTKLTQIEQVYSKNRTHYAFMEALVRRVKGLIALHTPAAN